MFKAGEFSIQCGATKAKANNILYFHCPDWPDMTSSPPINCSARARANCFLNQLALAIRRI